ncbi:MAG TPA: HEPN domain-containing protein [Candidatus Obscuribacterales bacterium]
MAHASRKSVEDARVEPLVQRLVHEFQPDYVYLFGSLARGDETDDSDYDFMVILPDSAPDKLLSWREQASALKGVRLERFSDIKFTRRSDFERQLHLRASIPAAVMRDGVCLYARPGAKGLAASPPLTTPRVGEPTQPEYDPVRVENTRGWLTVTRNDLRLAEFALEEDMFDECLFHCQQAVEKATKALLTWHDEPAPRHHDLPNLGSSCIRLAPSIAPELEASYGLSHWAINGRYPPARSSRQEAAFGLRLARQAVEALLLEVPSSIRAD